MIREVGWWDYAESSFSVQVRDDSYPTRISNGKGLDPDWTLASAYAEYLERLQNQAGTSAFRRFGLMPAGVVPPDEVEVVLGELCQRQPEVLDAIFSEAWRELPPETTLPALPFYEVTSGSVALLPVSVYEAILTNGMCAGNSPEEALVQGICEVFERYVIRLAFQGQLPELPTFDRDQLEELSSFTLLQTIESRGYQVVVKDCSLGGRFPVVATLVLEPGANRYRVIYGSDTLLDVALQRCLTEWVQLSQGFEGSELTSDISWDDAAARQGDLPQRMTFSVFCNSGSHLMLRPFFVSGGEPASVSAFADRFTSNRDALAFLVRRIDELGARLLVRDASFLGFPAFTVYIPGLSEISGPQALWHLRNGDRLDRLRRLLLDLKGASTEEARWAAGWVEEEVSSPSLFSYPQLIVRRLTELSVKGGNDFRTFEDLDFLIASLWVRAGEPGRAWPRLETYARRFTGTEPDEFARRYIWCAVACLKLRAEGLDEARLSSTLVDLFGDEVADEVIDDLSAPARVFETYRLPRCGDCDACEIADDCLYPAWRRLVEQLQAALERAAIDQGKLADLFTSPSR
jgi:YcaO-like protein with predicted kinase domain